jgi:hypothetical protein
MLELMDTQQKHQSFIDREASIIEQEVSAAVNAHLKNRFKRLKLVIPNAFMKVLRDPRDHQTKLTDLDGVFFLTKNPEMYDADEVINVPMSDRVRELLQEVETEMRRMKKVLPVETLTPPKVTEGLATEPSDYSVTLVIVEAKHYVTADKIEQKIQQLAKIEEYLYLARLMKENPTAPELKDVTRNFRNTVSQFKLHTFNPRVYMFIGGAMWDDRAYTKINSILKEDSDLKEYIGVVKASGARYIVLDTSTSWR